MSLKQSDYINILNALKSRIRQARLKAVITVNAELLKLYWEIGNTILQQQEKEGWGAKVIDRLAADLRAEFPDFKGLSIRNLKYMRAFAESYPLSAIVQPSAAQSTKKEQTAIVQAGLAQLQESSLEFVQAMLAQLSWYHHITLLDKVKDSKTRLFYIQQTVQNGWSRDVMVHQIESGLHTRQGTISSNFKTTIAPEQSELVQQLFKDPYKFEFIYLGQEAKERDLEDALINQLTKFLLELGQHFAFMGRQYRVAVGKKEYFFDLLFYHTRLKRYIVIDLKIDEFKPEYKGKMEFYLNIADDFLKQKDDEKSIGLILCKTKDGLVVEYALRESSKPIGIAEYKLSDKLPKEIKGELPTVEELEAEIEKEYEELKSPKEKKLSRLKEMIGELKQPKVKEKRTAKTCEKILNKVVFPLRDSIRKSLSEVSREFDETEITIETGGQGFTSDKEIKESFKGGKEVNDFKIEIRMRGFKPAGTKAFDIWKGLTVRTNSYNYNIGFSYTPQEVMLERLYHQLPVKKEFESVIEIFTEAVLDDITQQLERIKQQKK